MRGIVMTRTKSSKEATTHKDNIIKMRFICKYFTNYFYYTIRRFLEYNKPIIDVKLFGYHFIQYLTPFPALIPEDVLQYQCRSFQEKIFAHSFIRDYDLFCSIFQRYKLIMYCKCTAKIIKNRHHHHIFEYIAPYIICNYFDKPNASYMYYFYGYGHKEIKINKYLSQITQLKHNMNKFSLFIINDFEIEYTKNKHQRLVDNTTEALNLLQQKYNVGDDICGVISGFIL